MYKQGPPVERLSFMAIARKKQISLVDTSYYHCVTRCVSKAFLCGEDKTTGQSFERRRGWVEDKLLLLGPVFAIKITKTPTVI